VRVIARGRFVLDPPFAVTSGSRTIKMSCLFCSLRDWWLRSTIFRDPQNFAPRCGIFENST